MKHLMLLMTLIGFVSCNDLDGTFTAKQDLVFKTKKSIISSKYVSVKVPAGNYKAEFDFTSFDNLKIDLSGIDKKIKIKLPDDLDINDRNDEFYIQGADVRQKYDFEGRIHTDYSRSETRRETESCSYTRYETRCRQVCHVNNRGRQICRSECSQFPVTHYGYRRIEYYYSTRVTNMSLNVLEPSTSENVGSFTGRDSSTNRVVTWETPCR
ncbi:hypothetical protein BIY24_08310 [Halobacteriovorax marinus]|uniref:Lipoprotein n=1 Tax=Halobacteriovorax marinus (strain ATCC BAA-682 / DSM 15412 / SJ) TaxID=862908 RepID=E1X1T6_HALMS|nr:hypothetical protein [Halobacteriovorax marinus]ATH07953.1 hypothetical protein BIY24_08310 [Halobacteriovorax marinus]CBW26596.1 hypothetical protein BMS_1771 [Halobacteriovorax marinus SJ]